MAVAVAVAVSHTHASTCIRLRTRAHAYARRRTHARTRTRARVHARACTQASPAHYSRPNQQFLHPFVKILEGRAEATWVALPWFRVSHLLNSLWNCHTRASVSLSVSPGFVLWIVPGLWNWHTRALVSRSVSLSFTLWISPGLWNGQARASVSLVVSLFGLNLVRGVAEAGAGFTRGFARFRFLSWTVHNTRGQTCRRRRTHTRAQWQWQSPHTHRTPVAE